MGEVRAHPLISQCYLKGFTRNGSKLSKLFVVSVDARNTFETKPVRGPPAGVWNMDARGVGQSERDHAEARRSRDLRP